MTNNVGDSIEQDHFDRVVELLGLALDGAGASPDDRDAILSAIAPSCVDVVANPADCG